VLSERRRLASEIKKQRELSNKRVVEYKQLQRSINREERLRTAELNNKLIDSTTKFEILEQANVPFEIRNSSKVSK
jgi:predicted metallo-beta-lactamase superfamily hydrolase